MSAATIFQEVRERLMFVELSVSSSFDKVVVTTHRLVQELQKDVNNMQLYACMLQQKLKVCSEMAATRLGRKNQLPEKDHRNSVGPTDSRRPVGFANGPENDLLVAPSVSSLAMSPPIPYILRRPQNQPEQKQLLRFTSDLLLENNAQGLNVFYSRFEFETVDSSSFVWLFVRKTQNGGFDFVTCFPRIASNNSGASHYGVVDIVVEILDCRGMPVISKHYIIRVGEGNECRGRSSGEGRCQCFNRAGNVFLESSEVQLFEKCWIRHKRKPHVETYFQASVMMKTLPHDSDPQSPNLEPMLKAGNENGTAEENQGDERGNFKDAVEFVPVENPEEEITSGLSFAGRRAYREWSTFGHLKDYKLNARVNVELHHYAHRTPIQTLVLETLENLRRIPHGDCSLEENLEIVAAGLMYEEESLLLRSIRSMGSRSDESRQ